MTLVRFTPRFAVELDAAIAWYEIISEEVADDFRQKVSGLFESISVHPEAFAILELPYRVAKVKQFPWLIVYAYDSVEDLVVLIRMAHSASSEIW